MNPDENIREIVDENVAEIKSHALNLRRNIIRMLAAAGSGHPAGALGLADIYATLFFAKNPLLFRYDFAKPEWDSRDLLVISNGHTVPVYYAILAEVGAISDEELLTLRQFGSRLQGHPERTKLPWLETTSGPLGEGLSQAAGMAYAIKNFAKNNNRKVFCIVGDGELDEGENWEAMMSAAKNHLANLIAIVDYNDIQLSGTISEIMPLANLAAKFASFNWNVIEIDGNNVREIIFAFKKACEFADKPSVILAKTVPGKGVEFMENDWRWHGKAPSREEAGIALRELGGFARENERRVKEIVL